MPLRAQPSAQGTEPVPALALGVRGEEQHHGARPFAQGGHGIGPARDQGRRRAVRGQRTKAAMRPQGKIVTPILRGDRQDRRGIALRQMQPGLEAAPVQRVHHLRRPVAGIEQDALDLRARRVHPQREEAGLVEAGLDDLPWHGCIRAALTLGFVSGHVRLSVLAEH